MRCLLWLTPLAVLLGCDPEPSITPLVGDDWRSSLIEVRPCRASPDHDLEYVGLWMDAASRDMWDACVDAFPEGDSTCSAGFPTGATFVKPQYIDPACTQLARISIAKKDPRFADTGGWHWQELHVDDGRTTVAQDGALPRCAGCHANCDGFDQRCYMDP